MTDLETMIEMLTRSGIPHETSAAIGLAGPGSSRIEIDTRNTILKSRGISEPVMLFDAAGNLTNVGVWIPIR